MIPFLAQHGGMLIAGATAALLAGTLAVFLLRSPVQQLRAAELTLGLTLAWLALACLPLHRPLGEVWSGSWTRRPAAEYAVAKSAVHTEPTREGPAVSAPSRAIVSSKPGEPTVRPKRYSETNIKAPHRNAASESYPWGEGALARAPARKVELPAAQRAPRIERDDVLASSPRKVDESAVKPALQRELTPAGNPANVSQPSQEGSQKIEARPSTTLSAVQSVKKQGIAAPTLARGLAATSLIGCGLCIVWLAIGQSVLWWTVRGSVRPADWLSRLYAGLPHRVRPARLLVSARCPRPVAFGVWRPTIVLPRDCCRLRRRSQLRQVLLHEVGHIQQRDAWGQLLFNAALPLLFWNPLYWFLHARARLCRELLADDWAAGQSEKETYARELVELLVGRRRFAQAGLSVTGVFHTSTEFYRRMAMLLEREEALDCRCGWAWRIGAAVLAGLCLVLLTGSWGLSAGPEGRGGPAVLAAYLFPGATEESDEEAADEDDSDEERNAENERDDDDGDDDDSDGDDEGDDDDGDDEAESMPADEDESDDTDEAWEEEDAADEESLSQLSERRQKLESELAELESHIQEKESTREQRQAAREARQAERERLAAEAALRHEMEDANGQWREMLTQQDERIREIAENVGKLLEDRGQLTETVNALREQVEQLGSDRERLSGELESLRNQLEELRSRPASTESDEAGTTASAEAAE